MPTVITLPPRANATTFADELINEVLDAVEQVEYPQAVVIDDVQVSTENKARNRANVMRLALAKRNIKVRAHAIKVAENPESWMSAVSPGTGEVVNGDEPNTDSTPKSTKK